MNGYRNWRDVKAEKQRRDAARGRTPVRATLDPDRFIHTRGPHAGEYSDGEHVCVPECYEDQSEAIERGHWEYPDPRPEYRVLAFPWYDHDPGDNGHEGLSCAAGYELELYVRNPDQLGELGEWRQLGATQTTSRGTLDVREVREKIHDYIVTLADPHPVNVDPARITIFAEVTR